MSNHIKSLNAYVRVPPLLGLLDCRTDLYGLPLKTRCPVCREGVLTVYQDHVSGGGWHHCAGCGSQGDLIALASAALQVSIPEAIAHLGARGFDIPTDDRAIERYLHERVEYDARLMRLWETARATHRRPRPEFAKLAQSLGLNPAGWPSRWPDGIGQMIGGLTKTQVEEAFAPEVMRNATSKGLTGSTSSYRICGAGWDVVAAVPFFDMPGRVAGYLLVGGDADPKRDFVFKRANRGALGNQHVQVDGEAGLAFHPGVFTAAESKKRTMLAVHDSVLMLKLQARHLRTSVSPLPVVSWIDSDQWPDWENLGRRTRTQSAWQLLCGYKPVFWAPAGLDVYTLRQAIAADGWISTAGPRFVTAETLTEYAWKKPSEELWQHVVAQARPWPEVLSQELQKCKDAAIDRWLILLEHEQQPIAPILARCDAHVQERVTKAINAATWPRTIECNGRTVAEVNGGWSFQQNGRPVAEICDAVLRLDRVQRSDRGSDTALVTGRILYGMHELPVQVPLHELERDPLNFMRDAILDAGYGLMQCDRRCSKYVLQIAMAFQPPVQGESRVCVGFDHATGRLVLPAFTLEDGGTCQATTCALVQEYLPAAKLIAPGPAIALPIDALTGSGEMRVVWATVACLVANLLATEFDDVPRGTCLVGRGARTAGIAVAEALGCRCVPVNHSADVQLALDAERVHDWPIVFNIGGQLRRHSFRKILGDERHERRCIVGTSRLVSRIMLLNGGWNVIESDSPLAVSKNVLHAVAQFLPAYLHDLMGRCCHLQHGGNLAGLPSQVLNDMAAYIENQGGDPAAIMAAADVLLTDQQVHPAEMLLVIVGELFIAGKLSMADRADGGGTPNLIIDPGSDALIVRPAALAAALHHVPAPVLDHRRIEQLLGASGLVRGAHREGWLLNREAVLALWRRHGLVPDEAIRNCG